MEALTWIQAHIDQLLLIGTSIVTTASAIAAVTSTPTDDGVVAKLYKILDILALNFGKAKDKGTETDKSE